MGNSYVSMCKLATRLEAVLATSHDFTQNLDLKGWIEMDVPLLRHLLRNHRAVGHPLQTKKNIPSNSLTYFERPVKKGFKERSCFCAVCLWHTNSNSLSLLLFAGYTIAREPPRQKETRSAPCGDGGWLTHSQPDGGDMEVKGLLSVTKKQNG